MNILKYLTEEKKDTNIKYLLEFDTHTAVVVVSKN